MKKLLILMLLLNTSGVFAETLTFGIVPQQAASKLARLWTPILSHISQKTGLQIRFATAKDIPTFEKRMAKGEYDFAYMNPYHFVYFNKAHGYQALNKARDKRIKGIIVTAKNSGINELSQLNNKTLAFPAPAAFAATVIPQKDLARAGITFTPKYVSSHDSVYRTVAKGIYSAGGGVMRTFKNVDAKVRDQLKILWTTKGFTPHAIAANPKVEQDIATKVQQVLTELENSSEGKELLKAINIKGFENARNEDWDDVRALKINLLDNL